MTTPQFFLGRQPIVNQQGQLCAYELLFRQSMQNFAQVSDDTQATATVIQHAFGEMGLSSVLGQHLGFININDHMLMSDFIHLLPPRQMVLEILETMPVNEGTLQRCQELKAAGFTFAADDVLLLDERLQLLLPLVSYVKVDLLAASPDAVAGLARDPRLRQHKLLAEKVDSEEQHQRCLAQGFQLFQGYYFAKPVILSGKKANPSHSSILRLVSLINQDADPDAIEPVLKHSADLAMGVLRMVNSASSGLSRRIDSIGHALTVLGTKQLQRWLYLLLFLGQGQAGSSQSPLLALAATRARTMELLAKKMAPRDRALADRAFTVGILSLIDTLLQTPMTEILPTLNLTDDVSTALLADDSGQIQAHTPPLRALYLLVLACEQDESEQALQIIEALSLEDMDVANISAQAMQWVSEMN